MNRSSTVRTSRAALLAIATMTLAACGGGGDSLLAPAPAATPAPAAVSVSAAALVISSATPANVNGTLDKTVGLGEAGISNATGSFTSGGPNDYCRAAVYAMTHSGNARKYMVEVVFSKATKAVSYVALGEDVTPATFTVRAAAPLTSVAIDIANRRIGFTNTVLGAGGANAATLNGSLEFVTNGSVADRASCG
ncbi:hypothetical protein [Variovorax terrae]|uniref:Lipoprotein n=1 Tax=Variovorax terrae TaxID=2923278 RepID=A0A9X2APU9_9BURK|nr:hypothetical protein [Variovorax terrae]MCJ0765724.1 hypothetical protein [Variovorax terrae]